MSYICIYIYVYIYIYDITSLTVKPVFLSVPWWPIFVQSSVSEWAIKIRVCVKLAGEIVIMCSLNYMFLHLKKYLHAAELLFLKRFNSMFKYKNYITYVIDD